MLGAGYKSVLAAVVLAGVLALPAHAQLQPAGNPNADQVSALIQQALDAKAPEEKLDLAKKAIVLDPNNQAAIALRQEAMQAIDAKTREAEKQKQEKSEQQSKKREGQGTFQQARAAYLAGDIAAARSLINRARQFGVGGPAVDSLDRLIGSSERMGTMFRYLWIGSAGMAVGSILGLFLWFKRERQPYLETPDGKRYLLEGEVTNIGAVPEYAGVPNEIVVADKLGSVSRRHCQIHRKSRKLYLVDCNSSNGTYLNGGRIPPQRFVPLRRGARIDVARAAKLRLGFERKKS